MADGKGEMTLNELEERLDTIISSIPLTEVVGKSNSKGNISGIVDIQPKLIVFECDSLDEGWQGSCVLTNNSPSMEIFKVSHTLYWCT